MRKTIVVVMVLVLALSGCSKIREAKIRSREKEEAPAPLIEKIGNEELAKMILKPKRAKLDVARDPFRPLQGAGYARVSGPGGVRDTTEIQGFQFLGVARINNDFVAFLKGDKKKGTFRKDDMIKDYTIKDIQEDHIVLTNGVQTVTLKRGDKIQTR